MNEKFMKVLKIVIPTLTVILIASQLFGVPATNQQETLDLIQRNEQIEIEIAVPKDEEQGTLKQLDWVILAELDTYQDTLRVPVEKEFYVTVNAETGEKEGYFYRDQTGAIVQNNTFKEVMTNHVASQMLNRDEVISALSEAACNTYADLEADDEYTNAMIALNGYFNLLPDAEPNYANPDSTITRAEAMALLFRAETPVDENLKINEDFQTAVGKSEYTIYAQALADKGYLNLSDKSLNNKTFNGTITRGEFIYYLVNTYFSEDFANYDVSKHNIEFTDVKDGGDIAEAQGYTKDYGKSYEIVYMINNPDEGVSSEMYKALSFANLAGIIDEETRFEEGLTKAEAIEMLCTTYSTLAQQNSGTVTTNKDNSYYYDEEGYFDNGWEESGLDYESDAEDGVIGFQVMYNDDGTTYLLYNKDGSRYDLMDVLPNGERYYGTTEADAAKLDQMYWGN